MGLFGWLENAKLLGGGQSPVPMLNMRFVLPDQIINLNRVGGLSYIREGGASALVGATTRQRDLEYSELIQRCAPIVREAIEEVAHRQTRNRGAGRQIIMPFRPGAGTRYYCRARCDTIMGSRGKRDVAFAHFPLVVLTGPGEHAR